jgi:hypothetical protein
MKVGRLGEQLPIDGLATSSFNTQRDTSIQKMAGGRSIVTLHSINSIGKVFDLVLRVKDTPEKSYLLRQQGEEWIANPLYDYAYVEFDIDDLDDGYYFITNLSFQLPPGQNIKYARVLGNLNTLFIGTTDAVIQGLQCNRAFRTSNYPITNAMSIHGFPARSKVYTDKTIYYRYGKTGQIPVLANLDNMSRYAYEIMDEDRNGGDVVVYDTRGSATEADWVEVFGRTHKLSDLGEYVIDNGLMRIKTRHNQGVHPGRLDLDVATYDRQADNVLGAVKDDYIDQGNVTHKNGASDFLEVKSSIGSDNGRSVLKFDLSSVPKDAIIDTVTLRLYAFAYEQYYTYGVGRTYTANKVTQSDWVEADANWIYYEGTTPWGTEGGDYTTKDAASSTVPAMGNWQEWNVTSLVESGLDDKAISILIKDATEESGSPYSVQYHSSEGASPTTRPQLVVRYSTIEWTSAGQYCLNDKTHTIDYGESKPVLGIKDISPEECVTTLTFPASSNTPQLRLALARGRRDVVCKTTFLSGVSPVDFRAMFYPATNNRYAKYDATEYDANGQSNGEKTATMATNNILAVYNSTPDSLGDTYSGLAIINNSNVVSRFVVDSNYVTTLSMGVLDRIHSVYACIYEGAIDSPENMGYQLMYETQVTPMLGERA